MRKKIAFFAGGWGGDFIQSVMEGIINVAERENADVFAFLNYSLANNLYTNNDAEVNLYKLPDMKEFDGVILPANTFNLKEEKDYLLEEIAKYNIPTVSIEYPIEGMPVISSDNYSGMYSLVEHMIQVHKIKNALYISGPADHPEAMERLRAYKTAMAQNYIEIPEDGIRYGDWAKEKIPGIIDEWLENHGEYPEAIICANDIMAIATYNYLHSKNIKIPREVKVTGYDCTRLGQAQHPPIASVTHEWDTMGKIAAENLFARIDSRPTLMRMRLTTRFIQGGSCGCRVMSDIENIGNSAVLAGTMDPIDMDSHFRHFYTTVRKVKNKYDLHNSLSYYFSRNNQVEGKQFKMFLDPEFFNLDKEMPEKMELTFKDKYDLIVDIVDGKSLPYRELDRRECIFETAEKSDKPGYYVFVTLYAETLLYGYAMMSGPLNVASESQFYIWTQHMNSALEQVRNNMMLDKLWHEVAERSITDALTGAYNRHGCEQTTYPMMIDWGKKGGTALVMLVDVDRMKIINDRFGHASGDEALRVITDSIKKALPEGYQVSRYGGDEFFVGGVMIDPDESTEEMVRKLEESLADEVAKRNIEYKLTMSIGCAKAIPKNVVDIEKALVVADKDMYTRKELHHNS
ncbi:MAG: GGDEF domain-containing protein [Lachnospiraceae bacterium]|nr:GGDEF domain-containing protein [Lachnospiraceae bacterium]